MNNNEHAQTLDAVSQVYPAGDIYDAFIAGVAALREMTNAEECLPVMRAFCNAALALADAQENYQRALAALKRPEAPDAR